MKDTDKLTMTFGQLTKLISEAKESTGNDRLKEWQAENRKLSPVKKEIAKQAKELYKACYDQFVKKLSPILIKNNISFDQDTPRSAAGNIFQAFAEEYGSLPASNIIKRLYLYDDVDI